MRARLSKPAPIVVILLVGLLLRVAWLLISAPMPLSDYLVYMQLGINLLDHGQFGFPEPEAFRLPGYPAFLAICMLVSRSVFWLSLVNVLVSTGLILVVYELGRQLSRDNELFATLCALACAIYPGFIVYSPVLASEHMLGILFFGGLVLVQRGSTNRTAAAAGLVLGLAVFMRGEALFYLPAYLLVILFSGGTLRARTIRGALLVVCTVLVLAPWYVRNLQIYGPGVGLAASSGLNFYFSHGRYTYGFAPWPEHPELKAPNVVQAARQGWAAGFENLKRDPAHLLRRIPIASRNQFAPRPLPDYLLWSTVRGYSVLGVITERAQIPGLDSLATLCRTSYQLVLVLAAASLLWWRRLPWKSWLLLSSIVFGNWFCYCVVFYAMSRYRFVVEVVALMLAALTVTEGVRMIGRRWPRKASALEAATNQVRASGLGG